MAQKRFKVTSVLVMEDIRQEATGLQSLIGVFPMKVGTASVPAKFLKIVIRIAFDAPESYPAECFISLIGPSGKQVFTNPAAIKTQTQPGMSHVLGFGWTPATFDEFGAYQIRFGVDGKAGTKVGTFEIEKIKGGDAGIKT